MKTTEEKSIKNSETTIQLITSLYCEGSPKESSNCRSKKCIDTQCLCMDTEQLGLLLFRMFDDREWRPADFSDNTTNKINHNQCKKRIKILLCFCRCHFILFRGTKFSALFCLLNPRNKIYPHCNDDSCHTHCYQNQM